MRHYIYTSLFLGCTCFSWPIGSPSAFSYAHAEYNVDDRYPLHVHIRYPVKVVTACTACARMMNTWTTYRTLQTAVEKYSDFLVVMISVGLASARPNYMRSELTMTNNNLLRTTILRSRSTYEMLHNI